MLTSNYRQFPVENTNLFTDPVRLPFIMPSKTQWQLEIVWLWILASKQRCGPLRRNNLSLFQTLPLAAEKLMKRYYYSSLMDILVMDSWIFAGYDMIKTGIIKKQLHIIKKQLKLKVHIMRKGRLALIGYIEGKMISLSLQDKGHSFSEWIFGLIQSFLTNRILKVVLNEHDTISFLINEGVIRSLSSVSYLYWWHSLVHQFQTRYICTDGISISVLEVSSADSTK